MFAGLRATPLQQQQQQQHQHQLLHSNPTSSASAMNVGQQQAHSSAPFASRTSAQMMMMQQQQQQIHQHQQNGHHSSSAASSSTASSAAMSSAFTSIRSSSNSMSDDPPLSRSSSIEASPSPPTPLTLYGIPPAPRAARSDLRIQKDLKELGTSKFTANCCTRISFPDGVTNLRRFYVVVTPNSGLYARSSFQFIVHIPPQYPFTAPKVRCRTPCLHPNISRTGDVYLHLLRVDWRPVLSINAVIFALQLLFLEPFPGTSAPTASATPPTRPLIAHASNHSNAAPPSALVMASSKSATASVAHQFDEESILNIEVKHLLVRGERSLFEEMVRKTLEGGFYFGMSWPKNRGEERDSDDEDDDDEEEAQKQHIPMSTLLQQVDANARKAQITPPRPRQHHQQQQNSMMDDDDDDHSMIYDNHASLPPHSPSSLPFVRGRVNGMHQYRPISNPTAASTPSKSKGITYHRKRCFDKTSPSRAHQYNPVSEISQRVYDDAVAAVQPTKRTKQMTMEERKQEEEMKKQEVQVKCTTTHGRTIILRKSLEPTPSSSSSSHAASSSSASSSSSSNHLSLPSAPRGNRKRPSPAPSQSFSDGEYEEDEPLSIAHAQQLAANSVVALEVKDDSTQLLRKRPSKKQRANNPYEIEDEEFDAEMSAIDAYSSMQVPPLPEGARASSTIIPDLSTYAALNPVSADSLEAIAKQQRSTTPKLNLYSRDSSSPKRNASDCQSSIFSPITRTPSISAEPSFILAGRSSSRSLNMFGPTKAQIAPEGLSNLQNILASLPRTMSSSMTD